MADAMNEATAEQIRLRGSRVRYRVTRSQGAQKLRVRVGPNGIEVVLPKARDCDDVPAFLQRNAAWILEQLRRVERLHRMRRPEHHRVAEILFRGEPTPVHVEAMPQRTWGNIVDLIDGQIVVRRGPGSRTPVARSLESWLRKQARMAIEEHLSVVTSRLGQRPDRVYMMGQRTKWGNCSTRRNLSFNWRLILAPDFVLRYLVTHEAVHLAIPDHSAKFWLAVQSLCRDTEKAKQWLCSRGSDLAVSVEDACSRGKS